MFLRILLALGLCSLPAFGSDFDRTLPVSGAPDLSVSSPSGRIQIIPGADNAVHVRAHLTIGWMAGSDGEARLRQIADHPPIEQSGNIIRIGQLTDADRALFKNVTIDYQISAPRSSALFLHTGSGDVEVNQVGRSVKTDTGSGSIRVHGISGPADLHTGSGDVELQDSGSGDVRASTGSGSIRMQGVIGGLQAVSGSGDVEIGGRLTGASRVKTGSGSIRIHLGHEAHVTLDATTGSGTIRTPGNNGGERKTVHETINGGGPALDARTGSGDIQIN